MNIKILRQYIVPQHALSRLAGKMANCQWPLWKNWVIKDFIKRYGVDMSLAIKEKPEDYASFNDFFTRYLKPAARPISQIPDAIVSPADGTISQMGRIENDNLLQAKGSFFQLHELLAGSERLAQQFINGEFITIYLAPKDYHRVHMPLKGKLLETIHIPGKLFSVNPLTTEKVPRLFARNERLICVFETALGPMIVILVGAMLVASINTVWHSTFNHKTVTTRRGPHIELECGAELGHFKLGSTVIVLFPHNTMGWNPALHENSTVKMGEEIGQIRFNSLDRGSMTNIVELNPEKK